MFVVFEFLKKIFITETSRSYGETTREGEQPSEHGGGCGWFQLRFWYVLFPRYENSVVVDCEMYMQI